MRPVVLQIKAILGNSWPQRPQRQPISERLLESFGWLSSAVDDRDRSGKHPCVTSKYFNLKIGRVIFSEVEVIHCWKFARAGAWAGGRLSLTQNCDSSLVILQLTYNEMRSLIPWKLDYKVIKIYWPLDLSKEQLESHYRRWKSGENLWNSCSATPFAAQIATSIAVWTTTLNYPLPW